MEVKIVYSNVMFPYIKEGEKNTIEIVQINDKTTLKDVFIKSKEVHADVSKYYRLSGKYYYNKERLPYIKNENNLIVWEPYYNQVKVIDFILTHDIKDNTIYADTGIIQAGGVGLKEIIQLWEEYLPIIEQISTFFGLVGGVVGFGKFLRGIFVDKKKELIPPHSLFDFILERDKWNHYELAESLAIEIEDSKNLLQGLGYKWDKSKKMYVHQGDVNKIKNKLSEVSFIKRK